MGTNCTSATVGAYAMSILAAHTLVIRLVPGEVLVNPGEAHPGVHLQH
jgi:hypothetical protein